MPLYRSALASVIGLSLALSPRALSAQARAPLQQFWHAGRQDNYVTATADGTSAATRAGYASVRVEACVLTSQEPGTVPLYQFWSAGRGDNFATSTNIVGKGAGAADNSAGYALVRIEGYIYPEARKGTVALNLYYNTQRGDNLTTATAAGTDSALRAGYALVRILGYVLAAGDCQ